MIPCGISLEVLAGAGDVQLRGGADPHLAVRADDDVHPELAREPRRFDGALEGGALADVDADEVRRPHAADAGHVRGRVDGLVGDERHAERAHLAQPLEVVRVHRLLDEGDPRLGKARDRLERDGKRPAAVRVRAEKRVVAGELAREREPRHVRLGVAADLDLEGAEAEADRRLVAGAQVVAVAAERDLHRHLAPVRPSEQLGDRDALRAAERIPQRGRDAGLGEPVAAQHAVELRRVRLDRRERLADQTRPEHVADEVRRRHSVLTAPGGGRADLAEALDALVGDDADERERRGVVDDPLPAHLEPRLRARTHGRRLDGRDRRPRHVRHRCRRAARRPPRPRPHSRERPLAALDGMPRPVDR